MSTTVNWDRLDACPVKQEVYRVAGRGARKEHRTQGLYRQQ
jgi:hypothetical protein